MSTDFAKRLKSARARAGLTQVQLARKTGMPQSTIAELETRGRGTSRTATLAAACGVSALWLESGDGPMPAGAAALLLQLPPGMRRYPVLSFGQISAGGEAQAQEEGLDCEVAAESASSSAFFLQLEGDAMLPDFREGDRALIDPALSPRPGDCVLATDSRQQAILRKYRVRGMDKAGADIFELVPLNVDHPILRSDEQALRLRGTVVEHRRRFQPR